MGYARSRVTPAARKRWERRLLRPRIAPLIRKWVIGATTVVLSTVTFGAFLMSLSCFGSLVR